MPPKLDARISSNALRKGLFLAKYTLFGDAGANRSNSGNRVAIDQSLFQGNF
jgi:hypothetical protein